LEVNQLAAATAELQKTKRFVSNLRNKEKARNSISGFYMSQLTV